MQRRSRGVLFALASALLFGVGVPMAKALVGKADPVLLAGLLYLGSGIGLSAWRWARRLMAPAARFEPGVKGADLGWLAGAIGLGGIAAPVLLMIGLRSTPASTASLLLNLEGVFTASLAWLVFKENFGRRLLAGMLSITAGGALLSLGGSLLHPQAGAGSLAVLAACLAWAIDTNLTGRIAGADPLQIAGLKGLFAGTVNCCLALAAGARLPGPETIAAAGLVGLAGYGASISLSVIALRHIGAARSSAYLSLAPFAGAALSVVFLREPVTSAMVAAVVFMGAGAWLCLGERHEHEHRHAEHEHKHVHDEHHKHEHAEGDPPGEPHSHPHRHEPLLHSHPHFPDIHHHHDH